MKAGRLYEYISQRRSRWSVAQMCRVLHVSESGYYRSLKPTERTTRRQILLVKIKEIINRVPENENYGARRIHLALQQQGDDVSYSTVRRTMKENGMLHKVKRHPNGITREDAAAQKAENLIARDFTADEPGQKWLTDITEVSCLDGKLYVAPVLDCFNGEIVGLAIDDNMRAELCVRAFENACNSHGARAMLLHSDRGSQFTSAAFRSCLTKYGAIQYGAIQSMSGTGRCYDNARMESFFATLKKEKLYRMDTRKLPMERVESTIFRFVMIYYNRQRIYTSNPGGWPPTVFRHLALPATA